MNTPERKALAILFFISGFSVMAWVPRFPEIKAHLGANNGQFGTLLGLGAIGAIASLLTTGHLVERFGIYKMIFASSTLLFGSLSIIVHLTSDWAFLFANIALGAGVSAFSIVLNSQAFHVQGRSIVILVPRLHGFWSTGALSTAIISGLLAGRIPVAVHIDILAAFSYLAVLYIVNGMRHSLVSTPTKSEANFSFRTVFAAFSVDWVIVLGLTCATGLEFATADWITLFSTQELHMGIGISTFPYILFVSAMIIGRLTVHRIATYISLDRLVRNFPIVGGTTFIVALNLGVSVHKSHPMISFVLTAVATFSAGLGLSFLVPVLFDAAHRRSSLPIGIVLGQLILLNTVFIFVLRFIIAWTAQITSISTALMIPSFMLIAASGTAATIKKAHA